MIKAQKYESAADGRIDAYLADPEWVAEQKLDGVRVLAHVDEGGVRYLGGRGEQITFAAAAQHFAALTGVLSALPAGAVLDGELMLETGVLWVFDLPYLPGWTKPETPLHERRMVAEHLVPLFASDLVQLVPQARTEGEKRALWATVQEIGAEGIVVKRADAAYAVGRRTRDVLKIKITKTMDVVVTARNVGRAANAELALMRDGELVVVGNCSMIGKPDLQPGDCAEVKFLYVADPDSPRLYQPRLMRARPDKVAAECEWRQLDGMFTSRQVVAL